MIYTIYTSQHPLKPYKPMYKRSVHGRWHVIRYKGKDRGFSTYEDAYQWLVDKKCSGNWARARLDIISIR